MSQPIYENRFFSTDEMLKEYIRRVIYRKIFLLGGIFALLALVMLLVTWRDGEPVFMAIFGICLFIMLAILIFSPSLTLRQVTEDNRRLHNGQTYESVVRHPDAGGDVLLRLRLQSDFAAPQALPLLGAHVRPPERHPAGPHPLYHRRPGRL